MKSWCGSGRHEVRECYRIIETELNQLSVAETATETVSNLSTLADVEAQAEALRKGRFDKTRADGENKRRAQGTSEVRRR